jgi:hypothetical protein
MTELAELAASFGYGNNPAIDRIRDLLAVVPAGRSSLLDAGARDGFIAGLLSSRFDTVTTLDLEVPRLRLAKVNPVQGDITQLPFSSDAFDVVLCAEVLEHVPTSLLARACDEITRVARFEVVIGVPYRQDLRLGRTTCSSCNGVNPAWGHLNSFDEVRVQRLFSRLTTVGTTFVGLQCEATSALAAYLMDFAGNPWGAYEAREAFCSRCGAELIRPTHRSMVQRLAAGLANLMNRLQARWTAPSPNWLHMVFRKTEASTDETSPQR